jgi:hypothetical protein
VAFKTTELIGYVLAVLGVLIGMMSREEHVFEQGQRRLSRVVG